MKKERSNKFNILNHLSFRNDLNMRHFIKNSLKVNNKNKDVEVSKTYKVSSFMRYYLKNFIYRVNYGGIYFSAIILDNKNKLDVENNVIRIQLIATDLEGNSIELNHGLIELTKEVSQLIYTSNKSNISKVDEYIKDIIDLNIDKEMIESNLNLSFKSSIR